MKLIGGEKMSNSEKPYYLVKFVDKKWADRLLERVQKS